MPEVIQRKYFVDLFFKQSYAVLFANFVIPLPVAYIFRDALPAAWIGSWILALYVLTLGRVLLSRRYFASADRLSQPETWAWRAALLSWRSVLPAAIRNCWSSLAWC